jgi:hypothetical protein
VVMEEDWIGCFIASAGLPDIFIHNNL